MDRTETETVSVVGTRNPSLSNLSQHRLDSVCRPDTFPCLDDYLGGAEQIVKKTVPKLVSVLSNWRFFPNHYSLSRAERGMNRGNHRRGAHPGPSHPKTPKPLNPKLTGGR